MNPPKIFISATSGDLTSARQIAKEALLTINCHPVEQTNFEPDWRSVTEMLRGKIGDCQALIHLVGFRYGAEPDPGSLPPGTPRRSYTQMEYHLAREMGLRVYTFLLPETYPFDVPPAAAAVVSPEQAQLQASHRELIQRSPHLYESPANDLSLRTRLIALQEKVLGLEQEQTEVKQEVRTNRRWGLWAAAAILLILGVIGWGIHHVMSQNSGVSAAVAQVQSDVTEVKAVFTKERKFMSLILARANARIKDWENMKPNERFDLALDQIAAEQKIPEKELRDLLDLYVQRVEIDPDAEAEDKYFVLMRKQAFGEAAKLASSEGQTAEARMKQQTSRREAAQAIAAHAGEQEEVERKRAIDFYQKEGSAYESAAQYEPALAAYKKAAALADKSADPVGWAHAQNWVTLIHLHLARYKEAEPLMREILRLLEQHLGPTHADTAAALNNLAQLLSDTNRLTEAEPLMQRALKIDEASLGPDHPDVATRLNNLAQLLRDTNRLTEAEPLMRRALKIEEASYGPDHPNVACCLNNLALLLQDTNRLTEAEPLMKRALKIAESSFGPDHPTLASAVGNLAQLLQATNRLTEAEPLFRRALKIDEASFGSEHPTVARDLNNLGQLLQATNRLTEAEPLMQRAVKIWEDSLGSDHSSVASAVGNLALLLQATSRLTEAEPLFRRALKIDEASFGPEHPTVARDLNNLGQLLQATNRLTEAEPLMQRAVKIWEHSLGSDHPAVATAVNNLALLLNAKHQLTAAEPLMQRALKIWEDSLGLDHPTVAAALNNLALLLQATNRPNEAEQLYRRALKIVETSLGPDHPDVARNLNNLATLLLSANRLTEAEPMMQRAIAGIFRFQAKTGHRHQHSVMFTENYLLIVRKLQVPDPDIHARLDKVRQDAGLETEAFEEIWQEVLAENPAAAEGPFAVVITNVLPDGQAKGLGLRVGDSYLKYNGQPVTSVEQFIQLTGEAKGASVSLEVLRDGKKLTFTAKPGKLGTRIENRPLPAATDPSPAK